MPSVYEDILNQLHKLDKTVQYLTCCSPNIIPPQTGSNGLFLSTNGTTLLWKAAGSGSGTVTNFSVVSANGLSGTIANPTTTPALTLKANFQEADYVVSINGSTITAQANSNTTLASISGTDAYTVIQGAITALVANSGGSIYLTTGNYTLSNELTFTGFDGGSFPSHQISMIGSGITTSFIQTTSGKNAIVLKNAVNVVLKNFQIFCGASALSCILGDKNGANTEISTWGSVFDNLYLQSQSTTAAPLYLRNFYRINVPYMISQSTAYHGVVLENNSTTTNYGNSNFGLLVTSASTSGSFAGLQITSVNTTKFIDDCTFSNFENVVASHYGILTDYCLTCTFLYVDIEASTICVALGTAAGGLGTRGLKILSGYILPATGGTGISSSNNTGGCDFNVFMAGDSTQVPISDANVSLPMNKYDVVFDASITPGNVSITTPSKVQIAYRTTASPDTVTTFGSSTNGVTQTTGDTSTKIATDAFVANTLATTFPIARMASFEAQGNSTTFNQLGLGMNTQGTTTQRNVATTNFYSQQRRVGFVSATTANSKAGGQGNPQFLVDLGFTFRAVFGIQAYNAGHTYFAGMVSSYSATINGGAQTQCVGIYFNPADANWSTIGAQGSAGTGTSLGTNFPATTSATDLYDITITVAPAGTTAAYKIVRLNTGNTASGTISTVPQTGNMLQACAIGTNLATGVAASIDILRMYVITNN